MLVCTWISYHKVLPTIILLQLTILSAGNAVSELKLNPTGRNLVVVKLPPTLTNPSRSRAIRKTGHSYMTTLVEDPVLFQCCPMKLDRFTCRNCIGFEMSFCRYCYGGTNVFVRKLVFILHIFAH